MPMVRATYRLQFNHEFTFADAMTIVPYLAELGISHVYASPIFTAAPGSMHGYNVVDYSRINPEIGTREDFDRFVSTLHQHGMGLIIDFVPNHMGIEGGANPWWQDVLANGRMSHYADFFDIDWSPLKPELKGKVLLPFLGDQYGEVLERGELKLVQEDGCVRIQYFDTPFPIDPQTVPSLIRPALEQVRHLLAPDDLDLLELESVISALERLPIAGEIAPASETIEERSREQLITQNRLADLVIRNDVICQAVESAVADMNGTVGDPRSFDALDALLGAQSYRLSFWRVAAEEINYRRFFAINTLAAIRQEEDAVFAATHQLLISLLADGSVDGVRFDHPDGLWDPDEYFRHVQEAFLREAVRRELKPETDEEWEELRPEVDEQIDMILREIAIGDRTWPVWIVAEKILEHGEELPQNWQIAGTVGYEFAQATTGVLVDASAERSFDATYARFTGDRIKFPELVYQMKQRMMREAFPSEMNVLANVLNRISESDRHSRDFTLNALRGVLREIMACFSVYRTYTTCDEDAVSERDIAYIDSAVREAKRRNPQTDRTAYDFVGNVLKLHATTDPREWEDARCHFAMKMQQLTGPVMAKGLEDTAFYRFNRLTSLNEVGGDPAQFGTSIDDFHAQNNERLDDWPQSMVNSSTHDTKRSEDVRARISVLSEDPKLWSSSLTRWARLNRKLKTEIDGELVPHRADEYVIYQTLVGTWPLDGLETVRDVYGDRIEEYIIKVAREAGRFSNWIAPDEAYENALRGFVRGLLDTKRSGAFVRDFETFVGRSIDAGLSNALAQQVLKLTSPGVPDVYQGTEFWDDSLVDPDNRRPVDFLERQDAVSHLADGEIGELVANRRDGRLKLVTTGRILNFRRSHRDLFDSGTYQPVKAEGPGADHIIAFLRTRGREHFLVIVPRLTTKLGTGNAFDAGIWAGTSLKLPADVSLKGWRNIVSNAALDGDSVALNALFADAPVAVLSNAVEDEA